MFFRIFCIDLLVRMDSEYFLEIAKRILVDLNPFEFSKSMWKGLIRIADVCMRLLSFGINSLEN